MVPTSRIRIRNANAADTGGEYVLYWMVAFRRLSYNFSLQRAVEWAVQLRKPLVIFEPLRVDYRWASDRIHRFVMDGMADNAGSIAALRNSGVVYYPYVEPMRGADRGLLTALTERACVVVVDDYPSFFLPRMISHVASRLQVRLESVDSNGLLPLHAADRTFTTAFSFRTFLHKQLSSYLSELPEANPLHGVRLPPLRSLPREIMQRWPSVSNELMFGNQTHLASLSIDHAVGAIQDRRGGTTAARQLLTKFLDHHLPHYATEANDPDAGHRSGLSPYLHFGHISTHELFSQLMSREEWEPSRINAKIRGKREGWWGVSPGAESWLDEFVVWRELGYNMCAHRSDYNQYESLPEWARATLAKHERDPRAYTYSLEQFSSAQTHDPLWNASQTQLLTEGCIHNYLRMYWGKKILEWTETPREALAVMLELNNKYALDGRDPNSYSGIFWVLGRYDRAWGPERPIYGTVRYMSTANTYKKVRVRQYLMQFGKG